MELGENIKKALYIAFASFVFIVGLSMSYFLFKTVGESNVSIYQAISESDKNINSTLKDTKSYIYTGAEVRQSIYKIKDIGVDIIVDGHLYTTTIDPTTVDVSRIVLSKEYIPTYIRNTNGELIQIRFN